MHAAASVHAAAASGYCRVQRCWLPPRRLTLGERLPPSLPPLLPPDRGGVGAARGELWPGPSGGAGGAGGAYRPREPAGGLVGEAGAVPAGGRGSRGSCVLARVGGERAAPCFGPGIACGCQGWLLSLWRAAAASLSLLADNPSNVRRRPSPAVQELSHLGERIRCRLAGWASAAAVQWFACCRSPHLHGTARTSRGPAWDPCKRQASSHAFTTHPSPPRNVCIMYVCLALPCRCQQVIWSQRRR